MMHVDLSYFVIIRCKCVHKTYISLVRYMIVLSCAKRIFLHQKKKISHIINKQSRLLSHSFPMYTDLPSPLERYPSIERTARSFQIEILSLLSHTCSDARGLRFELYLRQNSQHAIRNPSLHFVLAAL